MPSPKVMCNECGVGIRADTPGDHRVIHDVCYRNIFIERADFRREIKALRRLLGIHVEALDRGERPTQETQRIAHIVLEKNIAARDLIVVPYE